MKNKYAMYCPSFSYPINVNGSLRGPDQAYWSYYTYGARWGWYGYINLKHKAFRRTSVSMLMADTATMATTFRPYSYLNLVNDTEETCGRLNMIHSKKGNVSFIDGHVSPVGPRDMKTDIYYVSYESGNVLEARYYVIPYVGYRAAY